MHSPQARFSSVSALQCVMLSGALCAAALLCCASSSAQSANQTPTAAASQPHHARSAKARSRQAASKPEAAPLPQTPPTPPLPNWPVNDKPSPASVVWDSSGLRINASNSSLQQILSEVSTDTGSKVEGSVMDQRVYGSYGPGQPRDVLSQLLQGSGYNVLLAGDIGHGTPREIVLTPRQSGTPGAPNSVNRPSQDPDDEIPEEQPEEPQPLVQQPPQQPQPMQNNFRPGFGPNGPVRTPQQVMEEMQQRQLLQQQQQQQAAPQGNPNPQ